MKFPFNYRTQILPAAAGGRQLRAKDPSPPSKVHSSKDLTASPGGPFRIGPGKPETSAKTEETVRANVAAQWHHADASEKKVQDLTMRPADIGFAALWTCNNHGQRIS